MAIDLSVAIKDVVLKNPVMPCSGTFNPRDFSELIDISRLGAVVTKGVSAEPWKGNDTPRIAEVKGGILNSIGLQNKGASKYISEEIPFLRQFDTKIIANICGHTVSEYIAVVEALQNEDIDIFELNISCPNLQSGGISFGTDTRMVENVVKRVRGMLRKPLIVKLTPNVTDITEIAKAAESSGADAVSLINTLLGMKIDIKKRKPVLANKVGGLSGGAVMPVAVRMVYQTARAVKLPIIGMGGIETWEDAVEFFLAGASAIAVGTASFKNPYAMIEILEGIESYMHENGFESLKDIILE